MANLQIVTSIKNNLAVSVLISLMFLIPINSDGKINTHSTIQQSQIHINGGIDTVKNTIDIDAHYPGGKAAWNLFFKNNFKYRAYDIKNGINGMVIVHFIISENGHISNAKILSGVDRTNDREVLRVINIMPDWIPVLENGKPVETPFTLSVPLHQDSPSELETAEYHNEEVLMNAMEQDPQFPGGHDAMFKFLHDNLQYPVEAQQYNTQGTVLVRVIVRSTGKITNVSIFKGIGHGLDEEAMQAVRKMPPWIPGRDNGKAVSCYFTIPVKFQLQIMH